MDTVLVFKHETPRYNSFFSLLARRAIDSLLAEEEVGRYSADQGFGGRW